MSNELRALLGSVLTYVLAEAGCSGVDLSILGL